MTWQSISVDESLRTPQIVIIMTGIRLVLLGLLAVVYPVQLVDPSCNGQYNTHPIVRDDPVFVSSVPNGKRFVVGSGYNKINIVHAYGTPYEMGYAFGKMMSDDLKKLMPEYFDYLEKQIEDVLKILPKVCSKELSHP